MIKIEYIIEEKSDKEVTLNKIVIPGDATVHEFKVECAVDYAINKLSHDIMNLIDGNYFKDYLNKLLEQGSVKIEKKEKNENDKN